MIAEGKVFAQPPDPRLLIRVSAGMPPAHSNGVGSYPGAGTGSRNPTYQCMPLQNGLFCD